MKSTLDHNNLIVDPEIQHLIHQIENSPSPPQNTIQSLVQKLHNNCQKKEVKDRYDSYKRPSNNCVPLDDFPPYPLDAQGYAVSFDPVMEEEAFWAIWEKYGFVVGKCLIKESQCYEIKHRLKEILNDLSDGKFDINDPLTYTNLPVDDNSIPCISRGFFEIYHDDSLAQLRQAIRIYVHHVLLWGRADLWTTFDRYGIKLPGHEDSKGLPLHVDQNPSVHPDFKTIQGVLALTDCPLDRGTFVGVPGSRPYFNYYSEALKNHGDNYQGEYVEAPKETPFGSILSQKAQPIPIRAGDMISWDSRISHANTSNLSNHPRIVAYISSGIAANHDLEACSSRLEAFESALGSNVRDAFMHASMRPRYTDKERVNMIRKTEKLSYLGQLLYGHESYAKFL